ncbi:hypothetical protein BDR05DRAFT_273614 [Suillus weaverae]|nr:hypothetical protein BDR05DRAFT_273614 [Suillus weaverae]
MSNFVYWSADLLFILSFSFSPILPLFSCSPVIPLFSCCVLQFSCHSHILSPSFCLLLCYFLFFCYHNVVTMFSHSPVFDFPIVFSPFPIFIYFTTSWLSISVIPRSNTNVVFDLNFFPLFTAHTVTINTRQY